MENDTRVTCGRPIEEDGQEFTCPGTFEVRVPVYFDRHIENGAPKLTLTAVGGGEGTEGVVQNCTDCGNPAPRSLYEGLSETLHNIETLLMGWLG